MAVNCAPESLAEASKCFMCLSGDQREAVKVYLMCVIAGVDPDPQTLIEQAKCFNSCVPTGMHKAIQTYLLCQILNA